MFLSMQETGLDFVSNNQVSVDVCISLFICVCGSVCVRVIF